MSKIINNVGSDYWKSIIRKNEFDLGFKKKANNVESFDNYTFNSHKISIPAHITNSFNISESHLLISLFYILFYKYTGLNTIISGLLLDDLIIPFENTCKGNHTFPMFIEEFIRSCKEMNNNIETFSSAYFAESEREPDSFYEILFCEKLLSKTELDALTSVHDRLKLLICLFPQNSKQRCSIIYNTCYFTIIMVKNMVDHLKVILNLYCNEKQKRLNEFSVITDKERCTVFKDFNSTTVEFPSAALIHQLLEKQALENPDNVAVIMDGGHLTYSELNTKANRLANFLIDKGIGADNIIAISMERSFEMIIGLFAILKPEVPICRLNRNIPLRE